MRAKPSLCWWSCQSTNKHAKPSFNSSLYTFLHEYALFPTLMSASSISNVRMSGRENDWLDRCLGGRLLPVVVLFVRILSHRRFILNHQMIPILCGNPICTSMGLVSTNTRTATTSCRADQRSNTSQPKAPNDLSTLSMATSLIVASFCLRAVVSSLLAWIYHDQRSVIVAAMQKSREKSCATERVV